MEQRGGPDLAAWTEVATEDVLDGDVELDLPSRAAPVWGGRDQGARQVSGSWTATDDVTRIDEEYEDAGFRICTTGTNTRLDARVVAVADGQTVPLEMHNAFAFDLTVTRLPG